MFVTRTKRSGIVDNGVPGPGSYNVNSNPNDHYHNKVCDAETFAAFSSTAPRFGSVNDLWTPGPGAYISDNVAPRRPYAAAVACNNRGSAPFMCTQDRFS
uniref:Uncharacterized protein n=1 Tax=Lygus hesperus TaxID=30085 RepID=A0A0A9ZE69_LYGHE